MSKLARWKARVERWRRKFKVETPKMEAGAFCAHCLTTKNLQRHHKGHEYYFACIDEEKYAARYLGFHDEDIVIVCEMAHKYLHLKYKPIIEECNAYLKLCGPIRVGSYEHQLRYKIQPSELVLESYRQRLVHICERYLTRARASRKQGSNHPTRRPR